MTTPQGSDRETLARDVARLDAAIGRQVLYVTPDENRDLHVWSHDPDDGDEDDEDLCLADIATYDGLHPIITALLDLRLSAALLASAVLADTTTESE